MTPADLAAQLAALKAAGVVAAEFHPDGLLKLVRFDSTPAPVAHEPSSAREATKKADPLAHSRMRPAI